MPAHCDRATYTTAVGLIVRLNQRTATLECDDQQ